MKFFMPRWAIAKAKGEGKGTNEVNSHIPQDLWAPCCMRWTFAADACGMVKMHLALAHIDSCLRLASEQKEKGRGPNMAFTYDKLVRSSLAAKAQAGMDDIAIDEAFTKIDRDLVEKACELIDSYKQSKPNFQNTQQARGNNHSSDWKNGSGWKSATWGQQNHSNSSGHKRKWEANSNYDSHKKGRNK